LASLCSHFAIALVLVFIASRRSLGQELTLANQIHESAIDALQVEVQAVQVQVNRLLHHPLEGALPLIVPLLTAAISHLRKPAAASE
jgi:hypothetical protein